MLSHVESNLVRDLCRHQLTSTKKDRRVIRWYHWLVINDDGYFYGYYMVNIWLIYDPIIPQPARLDVRHVICWQRRSQERPIAGDADLRPRHTNGRSQRPRYTAVWAVYGPYGYGPVYGQVYCIPPHWRSSGG